MSEQVTAFEIDLSDVRNEAQDTQKTLKELRQEVKDLRSQLENTSIGTEEFTDTLDELTRKQQELTNVTKSGVAAQKDSYNDLVNQMAILKKEWRATADEAQRAALGEQISDINSKLKEMDATLGNHQRNVGNYESALENVNLQLQDQNNNFQTGLQTVQGLLGAYQLVEGALQAMGVESEQAEEAIRKMQGVMAMTDGLRAISEGVQGFQQLKLAIGASSVATNGFKKALVATGIGAIIVAVGTLAANWEEVTKWLDDAGVNMKNFGKVASGVVSSISQMFKNLGKGLVQIFKGEFEEAGNYFKEAFNFAENYQEGVAEKEEEIINQTNNAKLELYEQDQDHYIKMCEAKYGADWKYSQEGQNAYKALFEARAALYVQDLEKFRENEIAKANYLRELKEKFSEPEVEDTFDDSKKTQWGPVITDEQKQSYENSLKEMSEIKMKYDTSIDAWTQKLIKEEQKRRKEAAEEEEMIERAKFQIASDLLGSTAELMKEDTVAQKALLTAQTLLNTYMGTMSAFAQTPGPIWVKIAAAVAAGTMGAVQLKNIWSVDPENPESSVGGSGSRIPSMSALQQLQNGPQATTVIEPASTETDVKDTRVYVVESDITNTQNKVKTIESESTF